MAILNNLVSQMQSALTTGEAPLFNTATCLYAFDPEATLAYPPNDQYAVIQPTQVEVKDRQFPVTGTHISFFMTWHATLWVFVRLATDEANRDDNYLLDATLGSLTLAESVMELFQSYGTTVENPGWGYELDAIDFQIVKRDGKGWAATRMRFHTDLTCS